MAKKADVVSIVTGKGPLYYPWLRKPDTRFVPEGQYKCGIILNGEEAQKIIDRCTQLVEESYQTAVADAKPQDKGKIQKAYPFKDEYDSLGNETGNIIISAKSQFPPRVYDAHNNIVPESVSPYSGSIGRMEVHAKPYFMSSTKTAGVTLYLQAVQIIELVTGGGESAFDTDENGYVAAPAEEDIEPSVPF